MSEGRSFDDAMQRLRAGDQDAAAAVFNRFGGRLIALARTRLDRRVRQKVDPEDVLQSVWKSFFTRHAQGQFDLHDWDGLWALLVVITVRKCGRQGKRFRAGRRNAQRETSPAQGAEGSRGGWELSGDDPTPSQAVALAETVDTLMRRMEARDRDILSLRLQGYTAAEIGARADCTERTVRRVIARVKERLQEMDAEADKPS